MFGNDFSVGSSSSQDARLYVVHRFLEIIEIKYMYFLAILI